MDSDLWLVVKDAFNDALVLEGEAREQFLDGLEAETRAEVEGMLRNTEGPLDEPLSTDLVLNDVLPSGVDRAPALPDRAPSLSDARIGPYRVGERIGRGGMGDVYRARRVDGLFDRDVALKVIRDGADTDAVLERFAVERRILGGLEHPGIARLIGAGAETDGPAAGRPWLALELVEGVPITDAATDLEVEDRVRLVLEVAQVVHYAHRRLVVHRDLKPSNVLVTGDGAVKLLDFGIAKLLDADADPGLTERHARRPMTRAYAAPEQVREEPVTTATDVYGLGLLLFEVLTGARPFAVDGRRALEDAILTAEPPLASAASRPPAGVEPSRLRGDLDVICRTALAKAPDARYPSAEAFGADLRRWLDDEPIEARPPSSAERARRFVRKHRAGVVAAALVALAVLGGAASTLWQARQTRVEADRNRATADFLADIFHESNPTAADAPRSALELIDRGAQRLEAELAGQPDLRARLLTVVADAYLGQGRADSAEALSRRALAIRQPGGAAPDPAEAVRAEVLLGRAVFPGDPQQGNEILSRATERARGVGDEVLLDALDAQSSLAAGLQLDPVTTVAVLEEAVALSRRIDGEGSPRLGRLLGLLGTKASLVHQHGRMEPLLRESLESLPASRAPFDRSVSLVRLSEVLQMTGQRDEARALADQALALRRRVLPAGDGRIAEALATRAAVEDDPSAAERDARAAVAILEAADDAPLLIEVLSILRDVLTGQERFDEAVEVARRHSTLAGEVYGAESTRYPSSVGAYARTLAMAGRHAEAAPVWDQAIRLSVNAYGPESAVVVGVLMSAGATARELGRVDQAKRHLERAFRASSSLAESSKSRAMAGLRYGEFLLDQGRAGESVAPLEQAVAGREALERPGHRGSGDDADRAAELLGQARRSAAR